MSKVFVTGGSGFVGSYLLPALIENGVTVLALARSDASATAVKSLGAEPIDGNLSDSDALRRGMAGCETVFHLAAVMRSWQNESELFRTNVQGTQHVIDACRAADVNKLIYVSAAAVVSRGKPVKNVTEEIPLPAEPFGAYARSKAEAERYVLQANDASLHTVVVRPPLVWGAGDRSFMPEVVEAARQNRFAWISGGKYRFDTCHVANLCEALLLAGQRGTPGSIYFVRDPEVATFRTFVEGLFKTNQVTVPRLSFPRWLVWHLGGILSWGWKRLKRGQRPPVSRPMVALIGGAFSINDTRARNELGFVGHVTRKAGLEALSAAPL